MSGRLPENILALSSQKLVGGRLHGYPSISVERRKIGGGLLHGTRRLLGALRYSVAACLMLVLTSSTGSEFSLIGVLVAMFAVQLGVGLPMFLPLVYEYIVGGQYLPEDLCDIDVPDLHVRSVLTQVRAA